MQVQDRQQKQQQTQIITADVFPSCRVWDKHSVILVFVVGSLVNHVAWDWLGGRAALGDRIVQSAWPSQRSAGCVLGRWLG